MVCRKLSVFILGVFLSVSVIAQTSFNLEQAKKEVITSNTSLALSYENYIRAQQEARAMTLGLLPNLSFDLFLMNYQYVVLRTIIPEPSRYFTASASRDLAEAAGLNRLVVKRNLLEDLEKNYFLYQMHKGFLPDFAKEVLMLEEIEADTLEAYELGALDFSQYYQAKTAALNAREVYLNAEQLMVADELALKLALEVPNDTELILEREELYNRELEFPESATVAEEIALNNAKELDAFDYSISAAMKMKKGVAISWLSWSGVGLDYFARNSIARSNVRSLQNEKKKATYEMRNQVSKLYKLIENQYKKMVIQERLVEMAHTNYEMRLDEYNDLRGTKIALKKAELSVLAAQRALTSMDYELEMLYIGLKRVLGTPMISNDIPRA